MLKTKMAPKATRNPGDKTEGVKVTRVGRDKGELPGANKRLTSTAGKVAGKNMLSLEKDAKMSGSITTPLLEIKVKGKSQSTITTFLAGGAQDILSAHITPPSEINMLGKELSLPSTSIKKVCIENNEPLISLRQGTETVLETEDNNRETSEKKSSPSAGNKQFQVQQFDQLDQPTHQSGEGAAGISRPAMEGEDLHKSSASPKKWGKIIGKDPQFVDWGKDSIDKFYSLTEESDLRSCDHSFGGSDDSETSEAENESSSNEPTVRQLRRQWKSVKSRPCSQEGLENSTSTGGRTLKWDYSGIGLADSSSISNQG
ncbi:hypothetical protein NDU88_004015 [Pleurodeles waltl]|uniref:Uncharacterized protein n=1 Tax=Pleurodeles waltl TaxID=8319 RepID=A0AAV7MU97_PLEWA|nr:hypothetical protein NDU88_004015 [Pleurodeles waltl]